MREWWSKLRGAFRRGSVEGEVDHEIASHLQFIVDENIERGMTPEEARAEALRHFGNITATRERTRDAWSFPTFDSIFHDLRYGLRGMRRYPLFSLIVVLTLALGIGVNTAIFSVVYTVLLRPLPYPAGDRLVMLEESNGKEEGFSVTWVNFQHWRNENHSFEQMAAREGGTFTLTGRGDALLTHAGVVTSEFFQLLGEHPLLGRLFSQSDDRPGAAPVVVLSHQFWATKLNADPSIVGSALALNGKAFEVAGVLPPGLHYFAHDLYVPMGYMHASDVNRARHGSIRILARLKPGVTLKSARADLDGVMQRLARSDPGPESSHRSYGEYLAQQITGDIRPTLLTLTAAVLLVLIIACADVAGLLLVHGAARRREVAIRNAIGAGASRIARQMLTETILIAAIGGGLGLLLAAWSLRALKLAAPDTIPRLAEVTLDIPVLLFATAITVLAALAAGLAPVIAARRVDPARALQETTQNATATRNMQTVRSTFVVAQIAITLVLTFASGLLLRSLITAETANPGFEPDHVLALEMVLPSSAYKTGDAQGQFFARLERDLRATPGVVDAGAAMCPPSAGDCADYFYSVLEKPTPARGNEPIAFMNSVDARYFETLRIPIRQGRAFRETDRKGALNVAIVNETFARKWWPSASAVGRHIKLGGPYMRGPICEIVGVVGDVSRLGLDQEPGPEIFLPFAQSSSPVMAVMIRTSGDPSALASAVRRRVAALDRNLPIESLGPLEKNLAATLDRRRFSTLLLTLFASLAIVLAAVGIYGVLNYWVAVRENDIAVRLAIGARRSNILRWAGAEVMRLAVIGIVLGLAGGWAASRWLEGLVYGVSARSPVMMVAAAAAVIAIAALAAAVPLWRAMKVDAVRGLYHS